MLTQLGQLHARALFLLRRRGRYREVFKTPSGLAVLADLKRFARHGESPLVVSPATQVVDPIATGVRIGRQEMLQRVLTHIHIDDRDLQNLKEDDQ